MRSLSSVIGPNVILQFDHLFEWSSRNFNKKCVLQSFARVLINSQKKGKLFFHGVYCNHDLADKYQDYSRHYHYDTIEVNVVQIYQKVKDSFAVVAPRVTLQIKLSSAQSVPSRSQTLQMF